MMTNPKQKSLLGNNQRNQNKVETSLGEMYRCRLLTCDKCTTLMQDGNSGGN